MVPVLLGYLHFFVTTQLLHLSIKSKYLKGRLDPPVSDEKCLSVTFLLIPAPSPYRVQIWFFMVPGRFSWFLMVPGWFLMGVHGCRSYFMVPGWFFMVPGRFSWF